MPAASIMRNQEKEGKSGMMGQKCEGQTGWADAREAMGRESGQKYSFLQRV